MDDGYFNGGRKMSCFVEFRGDPGEIIKLLVTEAGGTYSGCSIYPQSAELGYALYLEYYAGIRLGLLIQHTPNGNFSLYHNDRVALRTRPWWKKYRTALDLVRATNLEIVRVLTYEQWNNQSPDLLAMGKLASQDILGSSSQETSTLDG